MNTEILKKFQLEAGGSFYPGINPKMQERFAELIVKECIKLCNEGSSTQMTSAGAALKIAQHFDL